VLLLKLRNNSALHSKISSAVMILFLAGSQRFSSMKGTHSKDCYPMIPTSQSHKLVTARDGTPRDDECPAAPDLLERQSAKNIGLTDFRVLGKTRIAKRSYKQGY
jgi:hypothetical protein